MDDSQCGQVVTVPRRNSLWIWGNRHRMTVPDAVRAL